MPFKVYIAEDESWIRMGIKKMIAWDTLGLEFSGEAEDGEAALSEILDIKPDIVITDIRMPFIDGLSLGEAVIKQMRNIKFIFISGYREFNYVKEAMKLGVVDYILKPVGEEELNCVLRKTIELIKEENEREKNNTYLRSSYMLDLLEDRYKENDKYNISGGSYTAVVIISSNKDNKYDSFYSDLEKAVNQTYYPEVNITAVKKGKHEAVLIISSDIAENEIEICLKRIQYCMASGGNAIFSIGKRVQRLNEIPLSYNSAKKALINRSVDSNSMIVHYGEPNIDKSFQISNITNELRMAIELHDKNLTRKLAVKLINDLQAVKGVALKNIRDSIISLVFEIIKLVHEHAVSSGVYYDRCYDFLEELSHSNDISDIAEWLINILNDISCDIEESKRKSADKAVNKVRDYIDNNYCSDVNLNFLAALVYMNPAYLSSMFKRIVGENFIDYLMRKRVEKAKELLIKRDISVGEIAGLVGYGNQRHFSNIFRKYTGYNPSEFREISQK